MVGAPAERVAVRLPTGHDGHVPADDTTSAAIVAPAAPPPPVGALSGEDLESDEEQEPEERTVQQAVPAVVAAAAIAAAAAIKARGLLPVAPTKPSNQPVTLLAAAAPGVLREPTKTGTDDLDDDDAIEDSITATAPRLNAANLMDAAQSGHGVPISIPGRVEIRTLDDDDDDAGDKTEVRARPDHGGVEVPVTLRAASALPAPRPAAGRPPEIESEPEPDGGPDDDGVTTQAAAPRVGSVPDIGPPVRAPLPSTTSADEQPTRPGVVDEGDELLTRPGLGAESEPATRPGLEGSNDPATQPGLVEAPTGKVERSVDSAGYANDQDDNESVTARGGPGAEPYGDDSVTTQAPNIPPELLHAAIQAAEAAGGLDDTSAASTQKVKKPARTGSSPADEEGESITTQAPGLVTNMLRVIASGSSPELAKGTAAAPIDDEDDGPENHTAVMASAPLKRVIAEVASNARLPAIRPTGGPLSHGPMGAAAPRLEPSSASGLRVARTGSGSNERASLGQLISADARHSGALPAAAALGEGGAQLDSRGHGPADGGAQHVQPSLYDVDLNKGPSYGLLVAIVAVVSLAVPVILFVVLRRGSDSDPVETVAPSEPASEIARPALARGKAPRGKNGLTIVPSATASAPATPSASPSASASASGKPGSKGAPPGKR